MDNICIITIKNILFIQFMRNYNMNMHALKSGSSVQEASTSCAADWETLPTATGARESEPQANDNRVRRSLGMILQNPGRLIFQRRLGFLFAS